MALLSVEHLSVVYDRTVRAVDDVSLAIEPGEILALVGESGSGKSSVGLALTRLLPPAATVTGRVLFEGRNLLEEDEGQLRAVRGGRISYVFQDPASALNPVLTIGEQLMETITLHTPARGRDARQAAAEWLERGGGEGGGARASSDPPAG